MEFLCGTSVCALPKSQCLPHHGEPGKRDWGDRHGIYWEVDFTEVKGVAGGAVGILVATSCCVQAGHPKDTPKTPHQFQVGDLVYLHRPCTQTLEPHWEGQYLILLTTLTTSPLGFMLLKGSLLTWTTLENPPKLKITKKTLLTDDHGDISAHCSTGTVPGQLGDP